MGQGSSQKDFNIEAALTMVGCLLVYKRSTVRFESDVKQSKHMKDRVETGAKLHYRRTKGLAIQLRGIFLSMAQFAR